MKKTTHGLLSSDSTVISMNRGQFKMIDNRQKKSLLISCHRGTLWVTAAGDEQDYVLRAGQVLELSASTGNVLLQSISPEVEVNLKGA